MIVVLSLMTGNCLRNEMFNGLLDFLKVFFIVLIEKQLR